MVRVISRGRLGANRIVLAVLVAAVLLLAVSAYYPFHWDPPRIVHNDVTRTSDGALTFGEMNRARSSGTPSWLADAQQSGNVQIQVQVDPQAAQQHSPASFMMLASDFWHTDFAIAEDHSQLLVWLRRPRSDANGDPAIGVDDALRAQHWNRVDVTIFGRHLQIDVNGVRRLTQQLPGDAVRTWGTGLVALGGEVRGGGAWQGQIRQAEVRTSGHTVDYTQPGALSIPDRFLYLPDHVAPFPPQNRAEWFALLMHFLTFIVVGFLIVLARKPAIRVAPATLLAMALALLLAAGKFFFAYRHTAVADIVVQTAGALLGARLAWAWVRRRAGDSGRTAELQPGPRPQGPDDRSPDPVSGSA